jgi:hypothetical protein
VGKKGGLEALKVPFPRLFALSLNQNAKIGDMGEWSNDVWHWRFDWRSSFFVWQEDLYGTSLELIYKATVS